MRDTGEDISVRGVVLLLQVKGVPYVQVTHHRTAFLPQEVHQSRESRKPFHGDYVVDKQDEHCLESQLSRSLQQRGRQPELELNILTGEADFSNFLAGEI